MYILLLSLHMNYFVLNLITITNFLTVTELPELVVLQHELFAHYIYTFLCLPKLTYTFMFCGCLNVNIVCARCGVIENVQIILLKLVLGTVLNLQRGEKCWSAF